MHDQYLAHVPEGDGAMSEQRAFLTLGHVLVGIGSEHDPLIGLEDIRVIRHATASGVEPRSGNRRSRSVGRAQ